MFAAWYLGFLSFLWESLPSQPDTARYVCTYVWAQVEYRPERIRIGGVSVVRLVSWTLLVCRTAIPELWMIFCGCKVVSGGGGGGET